jgi:hypothetical protein
MSYIYRRIIALFSTFATHLQLNYLNSLGGTNGGYEVDTSYRSRYREV